MILKDKVAMITGGARGIGREIALVFAKEGCSLSLCDVNPDALAATQKEMEALGRQCLTGAVDVTKADQVDSFVQKTLDKFGKIDILVNNAGITKDTLLVRMSESDWDAVLGVNLKGAFLCAKAVSKIMMKQRDGRIVNMASIIGIVGNAGQANYAAAKAGLHILCDKPLSLTAEESKQMLAAVQKAGVQHMTLFTYRWMPFYQYIADLLAQGVVGKIYNAEFRYISGYARKPEYMWRADKTRANGALADIGSHMIDLAHWLIGDINSVSARLATNVTRPGPTGQPMENANDAAFVLANFANGAIGSIHVSMVAHMADRNQQQQIKIYGDAGSLEFDIPYNGTEAGAKVMLARNTDTEFRKMEVPAKYWGGASPAHPFELFAKQTLGVRQFVSNLANRQPVFPTFEEGYKAQRVIEAAIISDATNQWVDINQVP